METYSANSRQPDRYRADLLAIYQAALARVAGDRAVFRWLKAHEPDPTPRAVVAIGKAAPAMMLGASKALGNRLAAGLVITRKGHVDSRLQGNPAIVQVESAHPVPDASSLEAGEHLLHFIASQPGNRPLLFLLSGGTSSLVEVLPEDRSLEDLQALNRWLLASGLDICSMNLIRSRLSRIKGGQLRRFLDGREAQALLISDVPGDDPAFVGSGLLYPPPGEASLPRLPASLSDILVEPCFPEDTGIPHHIVAANSEAVAAAVETARRLGYQTAAGFPFLEGDAADRGRAFGRYMSQAEPGVYVMGGETTVKLPPSPGRGGRSQHLALAAAGEIRGREDILILAAGTDGSDGASDDAGALVDGGTWQRAADEGLDPLHALAVADSGSLLEATGDLVHTGLTGTNVMDLLIGLRVPVSKENSGKV